MKTLWRISNYIDLGGWGGKKFSSRWTSLGRRVVYLAESPTAALVETLVHLEVDSEDIPDSYTLLKIAVPDDLAILPLEPSVGTEWKQDQGLTRCMGDAWLRAAETPLARVPSAIAPHSWNDLLNPEHPDAKKVVIAEAIQEHFDPRLFRFGPR